MSDNIIVGEPFQADGPGAPRIADSGDTVQAVSTHLSWNEWADARNAERVAAYREKKGLPPLDMEPTEKGNSNE